MSSKKFRVIAQYILLVFLTFSIVRYFLSNKDHLMSISHIQWFDALVLIFLTLLINVLNALKAFLLLRNAGLREVRFTEWLEIFFASRLINMHLAQGGLVYRGIKLKRNFGFPYTKTAALSIFLVWIESIWVLAGAAVVIFFYSKPIPWGRYQMLILVCLAELVLVMGPSLIVRILSRFQSKLKGSIRTSLLRWHSEAGEMLKNSGGVKNVIFLTFITLILQIIWTEFSFYSLAIPTDWLQTVMFVVMLYLSAFVRLTPGNFGLQEALCGMVSNLAGHDFGNGVNVSVMSRMISYLTFILYGAVIFLPGRAWEKIKRKV